MNCPPCPSSTNTMSLAGEMHRERASGDVVGAQVPDELHVEVADRLVVVLVIVIVLVTGESVDGVDEGFRVRTITQVDRGQAEVRPVNHGLIEALQEQDERVGGTSLSLGQQPPREQQGRQRDQSPADRLSSSDTRMAVKRTAIHASSFARFPAPVEAGLLLQRGKKARRRKGHTNVRLPRRRFADSTR